MSIESNADKLIEMGKEEWMRRRRRGQKIVLTDFEQDEKLREIEEKKVDEDKE